MFSSPATNSNNSSGVQSNGLMVVDNYNNPYYLHPSDNPENILVSNILIGDNYPTWRHAIIMALTAKNKLVFVDGSFLQPDSKSNNFQSWTCCNTIVTFWILNSISRDISDSIIYSKSAAVI